MTAQRINHPPTSRFAPVMGWALGWLVSAAAAQTQPDGLWHGDISVGGSSSSGTTSATSLNLRADTSKATEADKISLYALVNYGRSRAADGVTTQSADVARAGGRYDRNLTQRYFAFGGVDAEVNEPGGVRSRVGVNAGAGWHVWRDAVTTWDLFTGLGHLDTRFTDGTSRRGVEGLLGQESTHKLGESSNFKQRLVLYGAGNTVGNRATFDATLATSIVGGWTFNTGLALRYTSAVAPGAKKSERLLTFGFGYKF